MFGKERHVLEEELLLAAEGELPARRASRVDAHLAGCSACRARAARLDELMAEFSRFYRSGLVRERSGSAASTAPVEGEPLRRTVLGGPARSRPGLGAAAVLVLLLVATGHGLVRRASEPRAVGGAEAVPRQHLTPGATVPVSAAEVCSAPSSGQPPEVPDSLRQQVFAQYGISDPPLDAYEVDYLITPELGGASSIRNLWPEPYFETKWNARVKDALEERLHRLVCDGDLDLATAQREISENWIAAYKKYFNTDQPLATLS